MRFPKLFFYTRLYILINRINFRRHCELLVRTHLPEKLVEIKEQEKLCVQFLPHFIIRVSSWLHEVKFLQPWVVLCRWKGMPQIPEDALVSVNVKADFDIPNGNFVVCLSEFDRLHERIRTWLQLNKKEENVLVNIFNSQRWCPLSIPFMGPYYSLTSHWKNGPCKKHRLFPCGTRWHISIQDGK